MAAVRACEGAAAEVFGVAVSELRGEAREAPALLARRLAVALAKDALGLTWSALRDAFGAVRGEPIGLATVRAQREDWRAGTRGSSPFSRWLADAWALARARALVSLPEDEGAAA
jgi:hypothetical protein